MASHSSYFICFAGVVFGGRLGYVLFYNLPYYLHHPIQIPAVWDGGMSFHGGLIGVILATLLFSLKMSIGFLRLADLVVPIVPLRRRFALRSLFRPWREPERSLP
jgi:phosphatidylglycerol---prolipoprotein diacylglyceryl transferase